MAKTIEEWQVIIKKLEGVMKTSPDEEQRIRVYRQIKEAKNEILKIQGSDPVSNPDIGAEDDSILFTDDTAPQQTATQNAPKNEERQYKFIQTTNILPVHPQSESDDINFLAQCITEFENEYWGAISDYHLDLDYAHSNKRDAFLNKLENAKRGIKEYIKILEQYAGANRDDFKKQLLSMASKQERAVIMEVVQFFSDLAEFIETLISDFDNHGNIIMNPTDTLSFDKLYGDKKLNEKSVIDGIRQTAEFIDEVLDHIKLPNLYRKKA